jgi:hypothetical protein
MLLSQIIRFNIQKKPYGKLLFTPRSSSPHAVSVLSVSVDQNQVTIEC